MHPCRRKVLASLGLAIAASAAAVALPARAHRFDDDGYRSGTVFTSSNASGGNELLVYGRNRDGTLALQTRLPTGGQGSGAGLGSQGAVTLSDDGRFVFVVNALSNTVSTFRLHKRDIALVSVVPSGGLHPISVAEHDGTVYVLNDQGSANVAGFDNRHGTLSRIAGADGALSVDTGAGPAQVGFSSDGDALVVTEKTTDRLTSWRVLRDGRLGARIVTASPGRTPFGFAFGRRNDLVVSEAAGGAAGAASVSSYRFDDSDPARPIVASPAVADGQTSACWVAVTPNGRYAFVSNTGSATISTYELQARGAVRLVHAIAGRTGAGSTPGDSAVSADGRHFYVRSGATTAIVAFDIEHDGSLAPLGATLDLPPSAVGLAAN